MRASISLAILAVAGRALAQPAPPDVHAPAADEPKPPPKAAPPPRTFGPPTPAAVTAPAAEQRPCEVLVLRAPYDVRKAIEAWVAQEAACSTSLEVRVVPSEGGLYLLAREPNGRIHERLVPDAQSAGVLIASWMANDSVAPVLSRDLPPPPPRPSAHISPLLSPEVVTAPPHIAPVISPAIRVVDTGELASPSLASASKPRDNDYGDLWLSAGVTAMLNGASGARVRGELDLWRSEGFALSGIASAANTSSSVYGDPSMDVAELHRFDLRGLLGLSWTLLADRWRLRVQVAVGEVWSHDFGYLPVRDYGGDSLTAAYEASVLLGYQLSPRWELAGTTQAVSYPSQGMVYAPLPDDGLGAMVELRLRL
jgi:hypothetical protein